MKKEQTSSARGDDSTEDARQAWQRRYENGNTGWDRGMPNPAMAHWLEREVLRPPARVLIPGCGYGHEVLALSRHGFAVTAVDIAPWPLRALRTRLQQQGLAAQVVTADLLQWEPAAPFDIVYEQTLLCAITPKQRAQYAARLSAWLPPGGQLLALFMQTRNREGPPYHCDMAAMRTLFPATAWVWPQARDIEVPHPAGHELGYVLQRLPENPR